MGAGPHGIWVGEGPGAQTPVARAVDSEAGRAVVEQERKSNCGSFKAGVSFMEYPLSVDLFTECSYNCFLVKDAG